MNDLFKRKELIYTIYREQSFSRAAQKLFISQPSLSLMVKRIEEQIGMPLFDRTCKPIRLTEVGAEYIAAVERIHHAESAFENYLNAVANLEAGSLGIGSNQLLSSLVLPRYITRFSQQYPKIRLSLLDANSTTLENEIMAGRLDIIIDNHELPHDIFEKTHIATEHLLLAVPSHFPENQAAAPYQLTEQDILAGRHIQAPPEAVPLALFSRVPFILMNRDNDTRQQTDAIFQETGFSPNVLFEMDRLATLYSYIGTGAAASVVSDTLVRNIKGVDNAGIRFYCLPGSHSQRELFVSYKRNKYYSRAMAMFIDSLGDLT